MGRQRRRSIIKARRTGTGLALVAAISFVAGMTDAIGFLMTGDFVSFMTGNTTRAAIAFGEGDYRHALILLLAIVTFVGGNAIGIVIAHGVKRRVFVVLGVVSALLSLASMIRDPAQLLVQFYLVVFAMGMINATVEHIEGLPIGLTYVTGALSRLGRGIGRWLIGDRRTDWTIQFVPWGGMMAGAICGAIIGVALRSDALWIVSVVALVVALGTMFIPRSLQHRFNHRLPLRPASSR